MTLAERLTQVMDSMRWVRCASGNVFLLRGEVFYRGILYLNVSFSCNQPITKLEAKHPSIMTPVDFRIWAEIYFLRNIHPWPKVTLATDLMPPVPIQMKTLLACKSQKRASRWGGRSCAGKPLQRALKFNQAMSISLGVCIASIWKTSGRDFFWYMHRYHITV